MRAGGSPISFSVWTEGLECYLAELYVASDRRGQGLGRALMEAAIALARSRGADYMDLGTSEDDVAARHLYESLGFTNRERNPTARTPTSTNESSELLGPRAGVFHVRPGGMLYYDRRIAERRRPGNVAHTWHAVRIGHAQGDVGKGHTGFC